MCHCDYLVVLFLSPLLGFICQAWWRGTLFRRRLLRALEQAKELQGSESDDSDEDIAEVDLSSFDYNIDDVWLAPEVPNLPQKYVH